MRNIKQKAALAATSAMLSVGAFAQTESTGTDYSSVTSAVDLSTVGTGILAVAGALIAVQAVRKGARMILGMVR